MTLGHHVDGVLGNLHHQIFIIDYRLATETGIRLQTPGLVQHVFFVLGGLGQGLKTLAHDDVAGGAGTGFLAGGVIGDRPRFSPYFFMETVVCPLFYGFRY